MSSFLRPIGILKKRMEDALERFEQGKKHLRGLETERDISVSQLGVLRDRIQQAHQELEEDKAGYDSFSGYVHSGDDPQDEEQRRILRTLRRLSPQSLQDFISSLAIAFSSKEAQYKRLLKDQEDLEKTIASKESLIAEAKTKLDDLQVQADQAKKTFEEYDTKYQAISTEIEKIKSQIADLPLIPS